MPPILSRTGKHSGGLLPGSIVAFIIALIVLAPVLPLQDVRAMNVPNRFAGPSAAHWLGQEEFGRDVLARLIWGGRASLFIAVGSALMAALLGTILGLLVSAVDLWRRPARFSGVAEISAAARRVFVTTILNPKAMLVGAVVIPGLMPGHSAKAVAVYVVLSSMAGLAWLTMGAWLPLRARPYVYKAAAVVLGAFSVAAATSSVGG